MQKQFISIHLFRPLINTPMFDRKFHENFSILFSFEKAELLEIIFSHLSLKVTISQILRVHYTEMCYKTRFVLIDYISNASGLLLYNIEREREREISAKIAKNYFYTFKRFKLLYFIMHFIFYLLIIITKHRSSIAWPSGFTILKLNSN